MHAKDFRKIDLVCAQEEDRPELQCVYLHEGHLYAADGYIAARLPAHPTDQDTDGLIPAQAVAMARGADSTITANKTVRVSARRCTFDRPEASFWPAGIDGLNKATFDRPGARPETHRPHFTISVRLLQRLATAICNDDNWRYLEIYLGENEKAPILVQPDGKAEIVGAIMPAAFKNRRDPDDDRADLWHALDQLKTAIANGDSVELRGDLLDELRKVLCVEVK